MAVSACMCSSRMGAERVPRTQNNHISSPASLIFLSRSDPMRARLVSFQLTFFGPNMTDRWVPGGRGFVGGDWRTEAGVGKMVGGWAANGTY